jgi:hypothetical protein
MALAVLATLCFLACAFYLYVLSQWPGGAERKGTTGTTVDGGTEQRGEGRQLGARGSRETSEKPGHSTPAEHQILGRAGRPGAGESRCDQCERVAHERIAMSLRLSKRS